MISVITILEGTCPTNCPALCRRCKFTLRCHGPINPNKCRVMNQFSTIVLSILRGTCTTSLWIASASCLSNPPSAFDMGLYIYSNTAVLWLEMIFVHVNWLILNSWTKFYTSGGYKHYMESWSCFNCRFGSSRYVIQDMSSDRKCVKKLMIARTDGLKCKHTFWDFSTNLTRWMWPIFLNTGTLEGIS